MEKFVRQGTEGLVGRNRCDVPESQVVGTLVDIECSVHDGEAGVQLLEDARLWGCCRSRRGRVGGTRSGLCARRGRCRRARSLAGGERLQKVLLEELRVVGSVRQQLRTEGLVGQMELGREEEDDQHEEDGQQVRREQRIQSGTELCSRVELY